MSPQPPLSVNVVHGSNNTNLLTCGLCGHGIVPHAEQPSPTGNGYPSRAGGSQFNTWSSTIFRKYSAPSSPSAPAPPPPYHDTSSLPAQIYIFRLSEPSPAFASALPLCTSGWCLARLRATCSLWSFLRTNILERIWEEEVQRPPPPRHREAAVVNVDKPPVPPRRKPKSSGFWGVASSFGLDRVPGWGENDKDKRVEPDPEKRRFVAPPLRNSSPGPSSLGPPPLPSRSRSRVHTPAPKENVAEGRRSSVPESPEKVSVSSSSDRQELPATVKPEESPTLSSLLVSSPDDADHSNEAFLTPSEDPAPAVTASVSGERGVTHTLPDSSQNASVATSAPPPDDVNKSSTEPGELHELNPAGHVTTHKDAPNSEHGVTHPHPPAASSVPPVSPPSRTGSPARPPLPRRAAARRAVPLPPPAVSSASPIPVSTADVSPAKAAEQPNGHHAQPEAHGSDSKADLPDHATIAPRTDPSSEGAISLLKEKEATETTGFRSSTPKAEAAGQHAEAEAERSERSSGDKQSPPASAGSPPAEGTDERVNSAGLVVESRADLEGKSAERMVRAPLPPPRHPRPVRPTERQALSDLSSSLEKTTHSHSKLDKLEEPGFSPDGMPYVGDGTWEERTWKELTRLREDMFWARVGSTS
jgi:Rab guanine nucleotide exchange factor SEC2